MKISLSIDISADELGSILAGALMGAKEAMASKKQKTGAVKDSINVPPLTGPCPPLSNRAPANSN